MKDDINPKFITEQTLKRWLQGELFSYTNNNLMTRGPYIDPTSLGWLTLFTAYLRTKAKHQVLDNGSLRMNSINLTTATEDSHNE